MLRRLDSVELLQEGKRKKIEKVVAYWEVNLRAVRRI